MRITTTCSIWPSLILAVFICVAAMPVSAQDNGTDSPGIGAQAVMEIAPEVLASLSEEEQIWYKRFHDGILFFDGWASISQEILEIYPDDQIGEANPMVQRIGVKIGTEWCKANTVRKIDTDMLKQWGERLRASIALGPDSTTKTLLEIEQEVDLLLQSDDELSLVAPQS